MRATHVVIMIQCIDYEQVRTTHVKLDDVCVCVCGNSSIFDDTLENWGNVRMNGFNMNEYRFHVLRNVGDANRIDTHILFYGLYFDDHREYENQDENHCVRTVVANALRYPGGTNKLNA